MFEKLDYPFSRVWHRAGSINYSRKCNIHDGLYWEYRSIFSNITGNSQLKVYHKSLFDFLLVIQRYYDFLTFPIGKHIVRERWFFWKKNLPNEPRRPSWLNCRGSGRGKKVPSCRRSPFSLISFFCQIHRQTWKDLSFSDSNWVETLSIFNTTLFRSLLQIRLDDSLDFVLETLSGSILKRNPIKLHTALMQQFSFLFEKCDCYYFFFNKTLLYF